MIDVRPAAKADTAEMADLLNEVIAQGGTTALTAEVTAQDIQTWIAEGGAQAVWHVARSRDSFELLGFQWIEPKPSLPPEAADIATFARVGKTGLGIGSALFDATAQAARALGYTWINANIRADNEGGLIYYQSRGFRTYDHRSGVRLDSGLVVDKVFKRFDLD